MRRGLVLDKPQRTPRGASCPHVPGFRHLLQASGSQYHVDTRLCIQKCEGGQDYLLIDYVCERVPPVPSGFVSANAVPSRKKSIPESPGTCWAPHHRLAF